MLRFSWLQFKQGDAFSRKAVEISQRLEITPDSLMDTIWIESQFNRNAINRDSGAYGLIQCLPSTMSRLGLKKSDIERMTGTEHLEKVVYPYLRPYKGRMIHPIDTYLAVFYPRALGKADNYVIAEEDENAYRWNKIIDLKYGDKDGRLEIIDVKCYMNTRIKKAIHAHRNDSRFKNKIPANYEPSLY
ncbi:transglycosylase SLT domain-containing protein [Emticicia sp. ODNR4P]|nr:transglycosylase SLT domain-containing protein [Emticicia sp. ODNR4P]